MSREYDISKKSDMRKFNKDLRKTVMDKANSTLRDRNYDVKCPHCKRKINIPVGKSKCPKCRKSIDFKFDTSTK